MNSFVNPLTRQGSPDVPEQSAAIKLWARQTLALTDDTIVKVGEFGCDKPTCPNKKTIILVMPEGAPTRKISIHKSMVDISEVDVLNACSDPRNAPS